MSRRKPSFTYAASASRLPSPHGGREPVSMPRKRRSGVRTLTKRGPAAFLSPSSHIPSASTFLAPASSFCGRSFQTRKPSSRSSSPAAEPPGARMNSLPERTWCLLRLVFFIKRDWIRFFSQSPPERSGIDYRLSEVWSIIERRAFSFCFSILRDAFQRPYLKKRSQL